MATIDDVLRKLDELQTELDNIRNMAVAPSAIIVNGLSDISQNAGLLLAGEFRAGNGKTPGNSFTGVRMGNYSYYNGAYWNIAGVYKDRLMFGLRSEDGHAVFCGGLGSINDEGIVLDGLLFGVKQSATIDDTTRHGKLEMFLPEGSSTPVFGISYYDDSYGDNFIGNGNFETGDLTGWSGNIVSGEYWGDFTWGDGTVYVSHI